MSGIFASSISRDDSGVRADNELLIRRSRERGRDDLGYYVWYGDHPQDVPRHQLYHGQSSKGKLQLRPEQSANPYQFLGCAFSEPTTRPIPEFIATNGKWTIALDGTVAGETLGGLLERVTTQGWESLATLPGQYAVLGYSTENPMTIYWATRAKPLYGLWCENVIRIASAPEYFEGMYHHVRSPQPFPLGPFEYGWLLREGLVKSYAMFRGSPRQGSLILSGGGLDTLVATFLNQQAHPTEDVHLLYADYGARATKPEWHATQRLRDELLTRYPSLATVTCNYLPLSLRTHSSLDSVNIEVAKEPIPGKATEWVPGRNTVLMAIGASYAEANDLARVVTGINLEAAIAYPDNELEWLRRWQSLVPFSTGTEAEVELVAPVGAMTKTEIVKAGRRLNLDWATTGSWSCYEGGQVHCGLCSSCRARRAAFRGARVKDPTRYAA